MPSEAAPLAGDLRDRLACVELSRDGQLSWVSSPFRALLGRADEALEGQLFSSLEAEVLGGTSLESLWSQASSSGCVEGVLSLRAASGEVVWASAQLLPSEDGAAATLVFQDRTSEIVRVRELRTAMETLHRYYAVIEFTLDGIILTANQNFLATAQYALEEVVGHHHRLFVAPEDQGPEYEAMWTQLARGEASQGVVRRIAKDGSDVFLQASYAPVLDEAGQPYKVIKVCSDVTEVKRAEYKNEGKVNAIRRAAAVAVFSLEGVCLEASETFGELLGTSAPSLVGSTWGRFYPHAEAREQHDAHWRELRDGRSVHAEVDRVTADGRHVHLQTHYTPLYGPSGALDTILEIAFDATQQVKAAQGVGETAQALDADSTALDATARSLQDIAEEAARLATRSREGMRTTQGEVEGLREKLSGMQDNVRTVAGFAEEAADTARAAGEAASTVNRSVSHLEESSKQIGEVVKLITAVAAQTNLLALNATIEAARAGEAGKGFAVVASEVKELAKETARATEDIETKIEAIQNDTRATIRGIGEITGTIGSISQSQTKIADAVAAQEAAALETAERMVTTAKQAQEVSELVDRLTAAADNTSSRAEEVMKTSSGLRSASQGLIEWTSVLGSGATH